MNRLTRVVWAWLVGLALVSLAGLAQAADQGIDCECALTGSYVNPDHAYPAARSFTSANGSYTLQWYEDDYGVHGVVTRVADGVQLLPDILGDSIGFSPDGDRFEVVNSFNGLIVADIFDLTSTTPRTPVLERQFADGFLYFSPHGRYAVAYEIQHDPINPSLDQFVAELYDVRSWAKVYDDYFSFTPQSLHYVGGLEPTLGAAWAGFGPDDDDRTFIYAYVNTIGQNVWVLINLETGHRLADYTQYDFSWGFSPCGDVFGLLSLNVDTSSADDYFYSTATGAPLGQTSVPLHTSQTFFARADYHTVEVSGQTPAHVAPNHANDPCTGGNAPVAAFTAPGTGMVGVPIAFTDQSTTSSGTLTAWQWDFGDGSSSAQRSPSHTYQAAGSYSAQLTVTNSDHRHASVTHAIAIVANQKPHASFTVSPESPSTHDTLTLTDTSTDDDGIASRSWNAFGIDSNAAVAHARACPPEVTIQLTVWDHRGQSDTVARTLAVTGGPGLTLDPGSDLAQAMNVVCPGEVITLGAGHYRGGAELKNDVTGAGAGATFIDGYGDAVKSRGWVLRNIDHVKVSHLTLSGGRRRPEDVEAIPDAGALSTYDAVLEDVEITDNDLSVLVENGGRLELRNSRIHHNDRGFASSCCATVTVDGSEFAFNGGGIYLNEASQTTFTANDVHDNVDGLFVDGGISSFLERNRFYRNTSGDYPAVIAAAAPLVFAGNLLAGNASGGIVELVGGAVAVSDSTIADNCGIGVTGDHSTLENSIVFGNGTNISGAVADQGHNLVGVDPVFAAAGDYHLSAGSPALDAGEPGAVPADLTVDGDGDGRALPGPGGSVASVDIGWDEWTAAGHAASIDALSCTGSGGGTGGGGTGSGGAAGGGAGSGATGGGGASGGAAPGAGGAIAAGGASGADSEGGAAGEIAVAAGAGGEGGAPGGAGTGAVGGGGAGIGGGAVAGGGGSPGAGRAGRGRGGASGGMPGQAGRAGSGGGPPRPRGCALSQERSRGSSTSGLALLVAVAVGVARRRALRLPGGSGARSALRWAASCTALAGWVFASACGDATRSGGEHARAGAGAGAKGGRGGGQSANAGEAGLEAAGGAVAPGTGGASTGGSGARTGSGGKGGSGARAGSGGGATSPGGEAGESSAGAAGAAGSDTSTSAEGGAALRDAEDALRELARMAAREELGDQADAAFALVDATRQQLMPVPAPRHAAAPASPQRTFARSAAAAAAATAPSDGIAAGAGIAIGQLLMLDGPDIDPALFPQGTMLHVTTDDGASADGTFVLSLSHSGSKIVAEVACTVTLTGPDGSQYVENVTGHAEIDDCPDANGSVPIYLSLSVDARTATGSVQATYSGRSTAQVDDNAELVGMTTTADVSLAAQGSAADVLNVGGAIRVTIPSTGSDLIRGEPTVEIVRDTASQNVGKRLGDLGGKLPSLVEKNLLRDARAAWQSGHCVELVVTGVNDANEVEPSSVTGFDAKVRHKIEGNDLTVPITASLAGEKSVSPTGPAPSPVSFSYEAGTEQNQRATVTLESKSKRGIAKPKEIDFVTQGVQGYEGTVTFSGELTGTSTLTWSGTLALKVVLDSTTMGGALFAIDDSTVATFTAFSSVNDSETCTLDAPVSVSGAQAVSGQFATYTTMPPSYAFVITAYTTSSLTCVDRSGHSTTQQGFVVGYPRTDSALGQSSPIPMPDARHLVGSAVWPEDASGLRGETSWDLTAFE